MSTSGLGATWLTLLDEKKHQIREAFGQGYNVPGDITGVRAFRSALENLCRKKAEHRTQRLEARLLHAYGPISELSRAVDRSITDPQNAAPQDTLEGLVYGISSALIEVSDHVGKAISGLPRCSAGVELAPH